MPTIDLKKAKTEFVDSLLGIAMQALGGVTALCKEIDDTPGGLGDAAQATFTAVEDLRGKVQAQISSYELDT